jgi:DNA-binding XRE family transcriptional regulator
VKAREDLKLNRQELAVMAGIDRTTLTHIENGRGTSVDVALAIAKALNKTVEYLFLP